MELGVVAGVHVTTMAAIPVARLEDSLNQEQTWREQPRPENPDLDDNINGHYAPGLEHSITSVTPAEILF